MNANMKQIRLYLNDAWAELDDHGANSVSFEKLHCAVCLLAKEIERIDGTASRAANVASCVANGIQPD